ncbi:oxidoreductase [Glutamicibacter uratoxydans]|uniref:Oxidoreductase n=1 Tax=Glutamicibacter uratoxydans TaxID=43667 RepID=A0A4Y4DPU6_GLUUR|nr:NADPH:quinone reductase [Glutamicibacter uratoxydans]GED06627.1 oxidoreductase [Glutamicibacter uratoxydans]
MKAAVIDEPGSGTQVSIREIPLPLPGAGEVLLKCEFAAVNHVDTFIRAGAYRTALPRPFVIGRDVVGTVEALGPQVRGVVPGQRMWTNSMGYDGRQGVISEFACIPVNRLLPVPEQLDEPQVLAATAHSFTTTWLALSALLNTDSPRKVFIGGAAGNVGSVAVQFAHATGAYIVASASAADRNWVQSLGADLILDYKDPMLAAKAVHNPQQGIDIWWDTSGHQDLTQVIPALSIGGTVLLSAGISSSSDLPVGAVYTRNISVKGFAVSNATAQQLHAAALRLNDFLGRHPLKYHSAGIFPLDQAARAHQLVESGQAHGKVLVRLSD